MVDPRKPEEFCVRCGNWEACNITVHEGKSYCEDCAHDLSHRGDPCDYCKTPHDEVAVGVCSARVTWDQRINELLVKSTTPPGLSAEDLDEIHQMMDVRIVRYRNDVGPLWKQVKDKP